MHSYIRPNTHVALRLPSGLYKIVDITPNTNINLGKFGTFNSNLVLGRPYYLTYELLDKDDGKSKTELRVVPASELHAEALGSEHAPAVEPTDEAEGNAGFDIVGEDGQVIMRNNRLTVDDASRQALSMAEIEELKKAGAGSGKDIIAKIMASHNAIDEKTSFSLAKYTLRKSRKYLRRFTALPVDVGLLTEYVLEKEAYKIMELREDLLGLICSWANIHSGATTRVLTGEDGVSQVGGGRWLMVDDTGGLVTAALAEKMGILYPEEEDDDTEEEEATTELTALEEVGKNLSQQQNGTTESEVHGPDTAMPDADVDTTLTSDPSNPAEPLSAAAAPSDPPPRPRKPPRPHIPQMSAQTNTLTILHPNNQPNLSYLKYFGYDYGAPAVSHPLYKHLKSLSWLSLLHPEDDPSYDEPEIISEDVLATLKSTKRGTYYKKRRRWERVKSVVDETRRGGFDGLVVATAMDAATVLKELVPLVRGGGRIVVYNPNVEPLVQLCDYYSKERRAAYMAREFGPQQHEPNGKKLKVEDDAETADSMSEAGNEEDDFPLNPTLLLAPSLQTVRARQWQVLPGRTHPMMTSKGGAEGYIFTATRVLPIEGRVEARGHFGKKKRKIEESG
ncbi:hypothetical protein EJ02DRAFT_417976 [Clathrospora elynae]|uniref:tRNA (adenine(58)-N(1))-methyltransferase non-catalytic subunit TRM6 n=1 Tax=Clathrospora elynae TaxID=706981 RepID=A0A6A5T4A0_9PLEO|nr:hypothetical protein EJ02DRAFT_417976 [Clathrospora elynae]